MQRALQTISIFVTVAAMTGAAHAENPGMPGDVRTSDESPQVNQAYQDMQQRLGFVPSWIRAMAPEAVPGAWATVRDLLFARSTIPDKYKQLIQVAVAAQVPCDYCLYIGKRHAMAAGATQQEIAETIAIAALTREFSTVLNGNQVDKQKFRAEVSQIGEFTRRQRQNVAGTMAATDANSAYADIRRTLGTVPTFMQMFPPQAVAGAWNEFKAVELSNQTALPNRAKELIGLAVASQIPCDYCTYFHSQAARMNGAGDAELREAIALAGVTRHWSTVFNGQQQDPAAFRQEVDRIFPLLPTH